MAMTNRKASASLIERLSKLEDVSPVLPPTTAMEGAVWWHPEDGVLLVRYDGTWVQAGVIT